MIHPSYTELIAAINNNAEDDDDTMMLTSRYSLVLATSKRARQLIGGAEPLVKRAAGKKPLSIAIDEFYQGKVKIAASGADSDEGILPEGAIPAHTEGVPEEITAEETSAEEAAADAAMPEETASEEFTAEDTEAAQESGSETEE